VEESRMEMESNVWDQQPGETAKAFEVFRIYRDMGLKRSHVKAYKLYKGLDQEDEINSHGRFDAWSTKYNWVARCQAYDRYMDQVETAERVKAIKEMGERHAKIACAFLSKVIQKLKEFDTDPRKMLRLTPDQLIKWFEVSAKIERLSRGETTESIKTEHSGTINTGLDLSKLSDDEFDTIHAILIKASHTIATGPTTDIEEEE
jgi:hypothetical protein